MDGNQILLLGLGIEAPWKLVDQLRIPRQRDRRFQPNVTGHSD